MRASLRELSKEPGVLARIITSIIIVLLVSVAIVGLANASIQPATAASPGSLVGGPGEAWTLTFYGSKPSSLATLESEWNAYYARSDFQAYRAEFGWDLLRLQFCFVNICGLGPDSLDLANATQMSWFDWVVSTANSNGLEVMPTEFSFTGSGPTSTSEMSTFISDWEALAQHENGNTGIALYAIANEIEDNSVINSAYGNLDNFLGNITNGIRTYEPARIVTWIAGPPYSDGETNVYRDWHVASYMYNSNREFSSCMPASHITNWPEVMTSDYEKYGVPTTNGEINTQEVTGEPLVNGYPECDAQAEQWISQMISYKIPYILWGYNQYRSNWDYILSAMSPTGSHVFNDDKHIHAFNDNHHIHVFNNDLDERFDHLNDFHIYPEHNSQHLYLVFYDHGFRFHCNNNSLYHHIEFDRFSEHSDYRPIPDKFHHHEEHTARLQSLPFSLQCLRSGGGKQ